MGGCRHDGRGYSYERSWREGAGIALKPWEFAHKAKVFALKQDNFAHKSSNARDNLSAHAPLRTDKVKMDKLGSF